MTRKENKLEEILISVPAKIPCALLGFLSIPFNPFFLPRAISNIIKSEQKLSSKIGTVAAIGGYALGGYFIAYNIIENPSQPINYIPVATNILFSKYAKIKK